ncbi:unnamed protein product [Ranitomeya imitator]|uniref:Fibronectin type-III domain-containing protein n=1 Tax=Ranitomeya imitator TaxID=111125 RepID=A0ABN9LC71_9NEOB|nr:unnamed protein product [Ranitomeya imitator]
MSRLWCGLTAEPCIKAGDLTLDVLSRPSVAVKESTDPGNIFEFETTGGGKGLDMWLEREGRVEDHPEAPGVWDWGYCRKRAEKKAEMADRQCGILVSKEERSAPCLPNNTAVHINCENDSAVLSWEASRGALDYAAMVKHVPCSPSEVETSIYHGGVKTSGSGDNLEWESLWL